jgi:hypothetical protein
VSKARPIPWAVIPALPGTRIEWTAEWCKAGSIPVHAWLIPLDIEPLSWDEDEGPVPSPYKVDTSSACGFPMVLAADGQIQDARFADLDGTAGEVWGPE